MENKNKTLSVKSRTRAGKGAARADRREGKVPGVIYGDKKPPVLFSIDSKALDAELRKPGFRTHIFEIDVEGDKHSAICQDIQRDIILGRPIHIDFLRINKSEEIRVEVPVVFLNEESCPGVKAGGALNIVSREIPVLCKPDLIPESIEIDLSNLQIGESIHIKSVVFPTGVKADEAEDYTIVTVHAPMAAEPEVEVTTGTTDTQATTSESSTEEKK